MTRRFHRPRRKAQEIADDGHRALAIPQLGLQFGLGLGLGLGLGRSRAGRQQRQRDGDRERGRLPSEGDSLRDHGICGIMDSGPGSAIWPHASI